MIVWLASYPRSGSTFFRIALHRRYRVPTYTVYDVDGVAARIGGGLMGAAALPMPIEHLRSSPDPYFVKTHRRRDDPLIAPEDRAICLVRDGRDCTVSWARLRSGDPGADGFEAEARAMIGRRGGGTGGWGQNVRSWRESAAPAPVWVRFDDLVAAPEATVRAAVAATAPGLRPVEDAALPGFAELHARDPGFFRSGTTGSHRTELPPELHDLFWRQGDNAAAMRAFGFGGP